MACVDDFALFRVGARVLLVGASGAGKSQFLLRAIQQRQQCFEVPPNRVLFCSHSGSALDNSDASGAGALVKEKNARGNKLVEFIDDVPGDEAILEPYTLLVFDDLLSDVKGASYVEKLLPYYLRKAHHEKLYCFVTVQTLFPRIKFFSTISENANYLILFRTPRSMQQIRHFATQIAGAGNSRLITDIYQMATKSKPYSYLYVSFHPQTDESVQFLSNLFGEDGEQPCIVAYVAA